MVPKKAHSPKFDMDITLLYIWANAIRMPGIRLEILRTWQEWYLENGMIPEKDVVVTALKHLPPTDPLHLFVADWLLCLRPGGLNPETRTKPFLEQLPVPVLAAIVQRSVTRSTPARSDPRSVSGEILNPNSCIKKELV